MPEHELQTLLIGHDSATALPALRETVVSLSAGESAGRNQVRVTASPAAALKLIHDGWCPDIVVVYQGVPDEFAPSSIDQLIGLLPLSRFVVVFGPWCESIGRSGQHWPHAWCVPIRHAMVRIETEFSAQANGSPVISPLASRDEIFARTADQTGLDLGHSCSVSAIVIDRNSDRLFTDVLVDQLKSFGVSLLPEENSDPDFVFLPATMLSRQVSESLTQLGDRFPNAIRVLISDLLTPDEINQLHDDGVITLSQLRLREELVPLIQQV